MIFLLQIHFVIKERAIFLDVLNHTQRQKVSHDILLQQVYLKNN